MYSTCIFCNSSLGTNKVIEHFPIGRRLAFDGAKGRLWAVCRKCERWNLSPLEERWEALEECERSFEASPMRASTDNIGMARVGDGLELVRVGRPQRPEMAAWRYGDQFGRRRRRYITYTGLGVAAVAGVYVVGPALGLYAFGGAAGLANFPQVFSQLYRRAYGRVKLTMPGMDEPLVLEAEQVSKVNLIPDENALGWALRVPVPRKKLALLGTPSVNGERPVARLDQVGKGTQVVFTGDEAIRVAGRILPKINAAGAKREDVQRAVGLMSQAADPAKFFSAESRRFGSAPEKGRMLKQAPKHVRLALEMSAHEDTERRALEGELAMLEAAWKEADEIAHISDNLLLPAEVEGWFARLKRKR
ncbi:MAG TPA: hypothetical protein VFK16_01320 [Gemmatimonadaceae bacterium]|jgi:hypothetical protein|nr:hypothetical protein [Gemmatimonadaceae bacterium]